MNITIKPAEGAKEVRFQDLPDGPFEFADCRREFGVRIKQGTRYLHLDNKGFTLYDAPLVTSQQRCIPVKLDIAVLELP